MSQKELADALGLSSQSMVSEIESGARPNLRAKTLGRIAIALGCTPNDIYDGVEVDR